MFREPFRLDAIAMALMDDKFYWSAYIWTGFIDNWRRAAEQLPRLFMAFMNEEMNEDKLYELAALLFIWAGRFFDRATELRNSLRASLDFIDQEKMIIRVRRLRPPSEDK